ncbi:hypothetical protein [Paenibacillus ehimensis]|uniref:Uncharacterized protein n=1 Tax=Paenibacillus ehimensis TaxID=79264 RepID=A0ABT8VLV4_9BACL|nr:hypothetical protein [Paenibacillus ehimensis]MDO3681959.1 hypothetical protein [Paenibacillus ehimensis]MDO3682178.1 hypothetical protein [Paenibacillus ehimensis]MEC0211854.1 hypothetical protein [Paenibacillus ehimensis]
MTREQEEHMARAKAWCFDNGVSEEEIVTAWNNALDKGVPVVKSLNRDGYKWWWLPPHLLSQLHLRYSK